MIYTDIVSIIDYIVKVGGTVICLAYFMFRDYKFMGQLQETLNTIKALLENDKEERKD